MTLRVLVVDDTVLFRTVIADVLETIPGVEVVGKASNGKTALMRIEALHPDLVTLDVEMPEMNGLEVLKEIRERDFDCGVLMVSALTSSGSQATIQALNLGAFDFVTKPDGVDGMTSNREHLLQNLRPVVEAFRKKRESKKAWGVHFQKNVEASAADSKPEQSSAIIDRMQQLALRKRPRCIVIGVSTGGPAALQEVIPRLPGRLGVPVYIVQHMPPIFTKTLADSLNGRSHLTVKEAEPGEEGRADMVYIAPGGKQMKVESPDGKRQIITITNDPPENNCRPAVDYLFRSVAHNLEGAVTAVVLTGMGRDGTTGARLIKRQGGFVIAQDEATSVVFGMPMEVIKAGAADIILPLGSVAEAIEKSVLM